MSMRLKLGFPHLEKFSQVWETQLKLGQIFIPSQRMCPLGTEVTLVLVTKGTPAPVELPGAVKMLREPDRCAPGEKPGFAVEVSLGRKQRKAMKAFLSGDWGKALDIVPEAAHAAMQAAAGAAPAAADAGRSGRAQQQGTGRETESVVSMRRITKSAPHEGSDLQAMDDAQLAAHLRHEAASFCARAERQTYYQMLGVDTGASRKAIRSSYLRLMRRFHPDNYFRRLDPQTLGGLEKAYQQITEAYETLVDDASRAEYDRKHRRSPAS